MGRLWKVVSWTVAVVLVLGAAVLIAFQVSPWPAALLVRHAFDSEAAAVFAAQAKHLPKGISEQRNIAYDPTDADARLDLFFPAETGDAGLARATVVWVHGGGWVSGSKDHIANYLRILAGKGFTTVGVDYSIAPGATYPTPVRQVNSALAFLVREAGRLGIDPSVLVLAGDSAGAQIAAEVANLSSDPGYARIVGIAPAIGRDRLKGVVLFCGPFDIGLADFDGDFGGFLKTVLWSYSGTRDFRNDPGFAPVSVARYVTPAFPPAFISAGNGDPLLPQSEAMAKALADKGVVVDSLFFPSDYSPRLQHEYQFNLDSEAGRLALDRLTTFLRGLAAVGSS